MRFEFPSPLSLAQRRGDTRLWVGAKQDTAATEPAGGWFHWLGYGSDGGLVQLPFEALGENTTWLWVGKAVLSLRSLRWGSVRQ